MLTFTLADVEEAYAVTGLKPKAGCWVKNGCACPLGALLALNLGIDGAEKIKNHEKTAATLLGLTPVEVIDIYNGFDNGAPGLCGRPTPARKFGIECHKKFLGSAA